MTRLVEDRQLRQAFWRGERVAMAKVYREYAGALFSLMRKGFFFESSGKTCRFEGFVDSWELENVVQEVFLRAFSEKARRAYDGMRPYRNYLFTIARNLVIDEIRRRGRLLVPLEEAASTGPDREAFAIFVPESQPDREVERREIEAHVEAFVQELQPGERGVFDERFIKGSSVETAARELGISEYLVKRTEKRLRKRFFSRMRRHGYFEGYRFVHAGVERAFLVFFLALGGAG